MSEYDADVLIVGGGFAGLTAARELTQRGVSVIVAEGRDRLGGRTWTRESPLGRPLEIGGTWVHWTQPHVWAEIGRYDLALTSSPTVDTALNKVAGEVHSGSGEQLLALLDAGMTTLLEPSTTLFPNPFQFHPVTGDIAAVDHLSVADKIAELDLDAEQRAVVEGMWGLNFSGRPDVGAYTQALRWCALTGGNWRLMFEACATYKLAEGTKSLIDAIAAQTTADIRLQTRVRRISQDDPSVTAEFHDGTTVTVRHAVVTVPINTLTSIDFTPPLPADLAAVAEQGQASTGCKVWARVRGPVPHTAALGPSSCALNYFQYEYDVDGDSIIVAFGCDAGRLDITDRSAVETALRGWIPHIEVLAVDAHDWVSDEFAGETWAMLRPHQLSAIQNAAAAPHGRVRFAGSDYACGWAGFIDGAIESGKTAAARVHAALA